MDMTLNPNIARRTALVAGLAGAGAVALAACGSSKSSSASSATSAASADSSSAAPAVSSAPTSSAASSAASAPKSAASSGSEPSIAALDSIKIGDSASAKVGDAKALLYRSGADSVVCFSAICTHQGCTVAPDGAKLACPCHGSVFDAKTGKVLQGPAPSPLPAIAVKVVSGQIVKA
jgi:cytochrome b6-f complex iron-sulfur subunit